MSCAENLGARANACLSLKQQAWNFEHVLEFSNVASKEVQKTKATLHDIWSWTDEQIEEIEEKEYKIYSKICGQQLKASKSAFDRKSDPKSIFWVKST